MKGKERVPVPVAGPAFRGGVKFVMFNVPSGLLQPSPQVVPVQSSFPPVGDPGLGQRTGVGTVSWVCKQSAMQTTRGNTRTKGRAQLNLGTPQCPLVAKRVK